MVVDPTPRSLAPLEGTSNENGLAEKAFVTLPKSAKSNF
jgi:hypothetical protein